MSSPLAERATRGWVHLYTRRLPLDVRDVRRAEVESDLWEHDADLRERGLGRALGGLEITGRLAAGIPADLTWRRTHLHVGRGAKRAARIRSTEMATTTTTTRQGYPIWLVVLAALMGGFAALAGLAASISLVFERSDDSGGWWGPFILVIGVVILSALVLVRRAPLASLIALAVGGLAFGFATFWMVIPIFAGVIVAAGAAFSAPRVLRGSQPTT